jgi:esterase/lipase superfamily enzyme
MERKQVELDPPGLELALWGRDAAHDWPWWRKQLAYHLPRVC